jgi:hypothetical protein
VPAELDAELRRTARTTGKTLNAVVVETLEHAKMPTVTLIHNDLDWFVGNAPSKSDPDTAQEWLDDLPVEPA